MKKKEIQEAIMYLEHTTKDDFNLENHQAENRMWAIKTLIQELQRKDNIINELKYSIQKIRDLLYEKFRIRDEDGYYSMNETDLQDFYDILDKIKELENDL